MDFDRSVDRQCYRRRTASPTTPILVKVAASSWGSRSDISYTEIVRTLAGFCQRNELPIGMCATSPNSIDLPVGEAIGVPVDDFDECCSKLVLPLLGKLLQPLDGILQEISHALNYITFPITRQQPEF